MLAPVSKICFTCDKSGWGLSQRLLLPHPTSFHTTEIVYCYACEILLARQDLLGAIH